MLLACTGAGSSESYLIQRLVAAAAAKLVLVDAPAGFGKTTLVAQWQASGTESRPFAWLSLDDGENDPSRLSVAHHARAAEGVPRPGRRGQFARAPGPGP